MNNDFDTYYIDADVLELTGRIILSKYLKFKKLPDISNENVNNDDDINIYEINK